MLTDPDLIDPRRLGREGYVQRLLTGLVLNADAPGWNKPADPSPAGRMFLDAFEVLCFDRTDPAPLVFVDEFELPSRHPEERAGWPDYALVRDERLVMIELKTERASHRRDQLPHYQDLARTHHPTVVRDLVYVTPTMALHDEPAPRIGERFRHVSWADLRPLIVDTWSDSAEPVEQKTLERLLATIDDVEGGRPARPTAPGGPPKPPAPAAPSVPVEALPPEPAVPADAVERGLGLAAETEIDGTQRALDVDVESPDELERIRVDLARTLRGGPTIEGTEVTHVLPWLWRTESLGQPMTECGRRHGYEIRLSRYKNPPWGPDRSDR